ncbi:thrombospondin type 3 repeat-containing protein [bacterium]|nr:thrombospondin type 3 repeat-containing protein [bacterium]
MKHKLLTLTLGISIIFAKSFTVSDPPMIYIYHFVSYDTTTVVFHGGIQDESQSKRLKFPLFNKNDISTGESLVVGKALDPKLVSAMVTSAVAKNPFVNIAGESIQNRIKTDNFIKLVKSYNYPKRTDFIFIGEINALASQYEIDLKLLDVSTQKIVSTESFNLPFNSLANLRTMINSIVEPVIQKMVAPFLGFAYIRVDDTSREKIRWNSISIRPLESMVGAEIQKTSDEDFVPFQSVPIPPEFLRTHGKILNKHNHSIDIKQVSALDDNRAFLAGKYIFKGFLKNNEKPFETTFTVLPGDLNEIHMSLPYTLPPKDSDGDGIPDKNDACPEVPGVSNDDLSKHGCPPPPPPKEYGDITISNIWNGVGFELIRLSDDGDELIMLGDKNNAMLNVDSEPFNNRVNKDKTSITVRDLPIGIYVRNSFASSEERFPGKHYVNLFSDSDTLKIYKAAMTIETKIADQKKSAGREIIIYFDPFTPREDDEYRLFLGESLVPFTVTSIAGELHIVGFPTAYSDSIFVVRDGFQDAIVDIKSGTKKGYYIANLNIPAEEESSTEVGFDKFLKFK